MKKVMIFGTFDGLHDGHRSLFRQATEHGDHIIAVIARDETVQKIKGRLPRFHEYERIAALLHIDVIDDIVLGYGEEDKCCVVRDHAPDIVLLGYDQNVFVQELYTLAQQQNFFIVRARPYKEHIYKSSLLNNGQNIH